MARKQEKIITRSWVHKDGELVRVDTLSPEDKEKLGTWLKLTYLNALYSGRATFAVAEPNDRREAEYQGGTI